MLRRPHGGRGPMQDSWAGVHTCTARAPGLESGVLPPGGDVGQPQGCSVPASGAGVRMAWPLRPCSHAPDCSLSLRLPRVQSLDWWWSLDHPAVWEPWGQDRANLESVGSLLLPRPRPRENGAAELAPAPGLCPLCVERPGPAGGCPAQPCPTGGAGCIDTWPEACPWPGAPCTVGTAGQGSWGPSPPVTGSPG